MKVWYKLTQFGWVFFEEIIVAQGTKQKILHFIKPEDSLPRLLKPSLLPTGQFNPVSFSTPY
jgi:hypothetical protein